MPRHPNDTADDFYAPYDREADRYEAAQNRADDMISDGWRLSDAERAANLRGNPLPPHIQAVLDAYDAQAAVREMLRASVEELAK